MKLHAIFAMTRKGVIGKNNALPWHLPGDLKRFKSLTLGCPVLMGRKTYESIGKPLPGRNNIILTKDKQYNVPGTTCFTVIDQALVFCKQELNAEKAFIIGGAQIIRETLD